MMTRLMSILLIGVMTLTTMSTTIEAARSIKHNDVKGQKEKFLRAEANLYRRYLPKGGNSGGGGDGGTGGGGKSCGAVGDACNKHNQCCSKDCASNGLCVDNSPPATPSPTPSDGCDPTYCQNIICPEGCDNCDQMVCVGDSDTECDCATGYTFTYCAAYGRQCSKD